VDERKGGNRVNTLWVSVRFFALILADLVAGPNNPLAIPVAALIGIPLYVRAETVIPIGLALTQKGMSLGAVIALIVGSAGMSIPEMSMLASTFKVRLVAVFVGVVFLAAVGAGFVFNALREGDRTTAEAKKEGIFARLFGAEKSRCCNVRIEEVPEDDGKAPGAKGAQPSSCCDSQAPDAPAGGGKAGAGGAGRKQN